MVSVERMGMRFVEALSAKYVDRTPVWLMRQAGRYMPEYRALREKYAMLELCRNPELACAVTLLPLKRFPLVDAGILFSDITMPFYTLNVDFELRTGVGPVISSPLRSLRDVEALPDADPRESLGFVEQAVRLLRKEMALPLIGFAGAPFTLAAYLIEGKPARDFARTRSFLYQEPEAWDLLMKKLTRVTIAYARMQIAAGVQAFQIFDSWVGALGPDMYERAVAPHMRYLFGQLREAKIPLIHFGTGTGLMLDKMKAVGADVVGVDASTPLRHARHVLGDEVVLQGNLDPAVLLSGSKPAIRSAVEDIFSQMQGRHRKGYVFNLGHGVLPLTTEESVGYLLDCVQEFGSRE
jgi:uroporphyrinogen decarboxylase